MEFHNTANPAFKPRVTMLIYGHGGVGKTTVGATAPNPVLLDFEGGSKYFGLRGIGIDVAVINTWADVREAFVKIRDSKYESVIIDPIGEAMEKLYNDMIEKKLTKLVQHDGQPTMAGWGYLKDNMRRFIKSFRDMDKHLILIAHVDEKADDEGAIKKRPMIRTKLAQELINLVDMVFYMEVVKDQNGEMKRILRCQPNSDKYEAKDRTGQLGELVEPNIGKIIDAIQGNERFAWMKQAEKKDDDFLPKDPREEQDSAVPPAAPTTPEVQAQHDEIAASIPGPSDVVTPTVENTAEFVNEPPKRIDTNDLALWDRAELIDLRELAVKKLQPNLLIECSVLDAINEKFATHYRVPRDIMGMKANAMIGMLKVVKEKTDEQPQA